MRLGDLDDLKEEFDIIASKSAIGYWRTIPIWHIKQFIDNAPTVSENKYKRAFEIACDLLNGSILYGIDADTLFDLIMKEYGVISTLDYQKFILEHLDRFDDNDEVRMKAIERLGW